MLPTLLLLLLPAQSCPPPFVIVRPSAPVVNYGVETGHVRSGPRYRLSGNIVGRDEALMALGDRAEQSVEGPGKPLPDRSRQKWLTVRGSVADRKAFCDQLPAGTERAVRFNDYDDDHWAMRPGFAKGGKPTVYLQDSAGRVLHRQDDAQMTPAVLAALREPDKGYDPRSDPDLRKGPAGGKADGRGLLFLAALMAGTAVAGAALRKAD